jgi:cyclophilin family peptidyl-prolyl cis-trans isomerase
MLSIKGAVVCSIVLGMMTTEAAQAANPVVVMETSTGTIKIELFEQKAPITVKNFLAYTDDKFYDGLIFHRVLGKENFDRDFMIQGGGFGPGMKKEKDTKPAIKNESSNGLSNVRGTIAMARTNAPDSATSQFFINVGDNLFLDGAPGKPGYAVFGRVIAGMDVVDKIKAVKTVKRGENEGIPVEDIVIKSVRREEAKK